MSQCAVHLTVLLTGAFLLFVLYLGGYDLWPADEPRFGEVAREMMASGISLVPHVNGRPYLEKPPLLFWARVLCSMPAGDVTEFSARFPSAVSGIAAGLLTYLLAARLMGPRVAFWSALVLLTSSRFWWQARTAQIDMLLTACLMGVLYCLWRWEDERRAVWLLPLYLCVAAATYAKESMGLVYTLLFVFTFYWRNRHARREIHWFVGALAVAGAEALWYIPARLGAADTTAEAVQSGLLANLFRNSIGRFLLGVSKAQPPWYYLTPIPADMMPWTLFLPWVLLWIWRHGGDNKAMRFLLCWTVPALIFFSISIGKRATYILPLFPVFAIFTAAAVLELMDGAHVRWRKRIGIAWGLALILIGVAAFAVRFTPYAANATRGTDFLGTVALLFGILSLVYAVRTGAARLHVAVAMQTAVLLFFTPFLVFPIINEHKSARGICAPVRRLAEAGVPFRLYSVGFSREEYVFYSKHFHEPVLTDVIPMEGIDAAALAKLAEKQKTARKLIAKSVAEAPIADMANVTPQERQALREAIDAAIAATGSNADALRFFEGSLQNAIDEFAAQFANAGPAFMFVQDEDWRWLLPLHSQPPDYAVVQHRAVGSRDVLLLANRAGADALRAGSGEGRNQ